MTQNSLAFVIGSQQKKGPKQLTYFDSDRIFPISNANVNTFKPKAKFLLNPLANPFFNQETFKQNILPFQPLNPDANQFIPLSYKSMSRLNVFAPFFYPSCTVKCNSCMKSPFQNDSTYVSTDNCMDVSVSKIQQTVSLSDDNSLRESLSSPKALGIGIPNISKMQGNLVSLTNYVSNCSPSLGISSLGGDNSSNEQVKKFYSPIPFDCITPKTLRSPKISRRMLRVSNSTNQVGCEDATTVLRDIRVKNVNRIMIGTLNINSLRSKFEELKVIVDNYFDILLIQETKLDPSFPEAQFHINGYKTPYRQDRNSFGGGIIIYVREDIPSKLLNKHSFTKNVEGLFVEINLRKTKLLLFGTYHSNHPVYGMNDEQYFKEIGHALDVYANYDKFLIAGDLNAEEHEKYTKDFLHEHNAKNLVKEKTCFKSLTNPSCIDLFITNSHQSFQHTTTLTTGLSDFHKMVVTFMKTTFPKAKPQIIQYRDQKNFVLENFKVELDRKLKTNEINTYSQFHGIYLDVLEQHAPMKKKVYRANHKPYMTKDVRKAIMRKSALKNKYHRDRLPELEVAYKKQKNYTRRLIKRAKTEYFSNLNLERITDSKKFWKTVKPLFTDQQGGSQKITLVKNSKIISEDKEVAETFNKFFINSVQCLHLPENGALQNSTGTLTDPVKVALKKFEIHPSILEIKKLVSVNTKFSFFKVSVSEIDSEIKGLKPNIACSLLGIQAKFLKQVVDIIVEPLMNIWNREIIENQKFPCKLKLANITPIFKKFESVLEKNYRPVSILPIVSKVFERIMQGQMKTYINKYLSPFLCGYRKGYNAQYALTAMIEKWKESLDKKGNAGAILMDLSKAFDTINHELLVAKLAAYGFGDNALNILSGYLTNRWQRTKINTSFSSWKELLTGVPQGSVLGPLLFNIYINDLFSCLHNTHVCNFADDTTLNAFDKSLKELLYNLEYDTLSAIVWFRDNFMKLNEDKCHFLITGNFHEHLFTKVGGELIWESTEEKLLGITIDKNLNFNSHLAKLCQKVGQKISALARIAKLLPFHKRKLLLNTFIESQFSHCPLVWMFCSRRMNRKINDLHERALRLVHTDNTSSFNELLVKDKSISIHHRNIHRVAIEMFKVINQLCPSIMCEMFKLYIGPSTRSKKMFVKPKSNTVYKGDNSLRTFGPKVWDEMLPDELKKCSNLSEFSYRIKSWVPINCTCRLCKTYIQRVGFEI